MRGQGLPGVVAVRAGSGYPEGVTDDWQEVRVGGTERPGTPRRGTARPGPRHDGYGRASLSNPDKVLYPATGTIKADVLGHYLAVAEVMVPHLDGRPATLKRWPDGVEGPSFFEKNVARHAPDWLRTARVGTPGGRSESADFAAFSAAADHGLRYVEMDVHASADGVPFVHHDPTLDRTTDGTGRIDARPAAELDTVRVTGTHRAEPLPRLAAVPGVRVTIELKSAEVVAPTLAVLDAADAWDRVCLGSFSARWLGRARGLAGPRLCTSMGQAEVVALRARAWGVPGRLLPASAGVFAQVPPRFGPVPVASDRRFVEAAHRAGREVHVWTVDEPGQMRRLLALGVDGLLSDRPDRLLDVVGG
ncbi:glycerophosphodiester phosphodiesterase family protein [Pseudonocardia sp. ICBG1293]|uniref:non-homologous end-joining DNA ligase LigD n=1 Tax=Pseudonocardia sp. ICBG1293 TaxID=2844382 RepID=UPI001CCB3FAA|nr:glycerophosphodiester phosphodiesterase family protein [Pseudonocardia sp. ICBG1293]